MSSGMACETRCFPATGHLFEFLRAGAALLVTDEKVILRPPSPVGGVDAIIKVIPDLFWVVAEVLHGQRAKTIDAWKPVHRSAI